MQNRISENRVLVPVVRSDAWVDDETDDTPDSISPDAGQVIPLSNREGDEVRSWYISCLCSVAQALVGGKDWGHEPIEVISDWIVDGYVGVDGYEYAAQQHDFSHAAPEILEEARRNIRGLTDAVHALAEKHGAIMGDDTPNGAWWAMCDIIGWNPHLIIMYENMLLP